MALRPQLLDEIVRIVTPTFTEPTARVFVFNEWEGSPGFVSVYTARQSKPFLLQFHPIVSFTRSRRPRREPHIVTLEDGTEWHLFKGGCGCGSPIKKVSTRMALSDIDHILATAQSPLPVPAQELVGG